VSVPSNSAGAGKFPILCYVTDRRSLSLTTASANVSVLAEKIATLAGSGVDWVQIREKDLSARQLTGLVRATLRCTLVQTHRDPDMPRIIVNDRVDVALTAGAGGVHLGERSLPVGDAKVVVRSRASVKNFLLGVSCHSLESVKSAAGGGADYAFFGPVFATPSKAAFREPQGLRRLAEVCRSMPIPVLAIGGITVENADKCFAAGAAGIAAIRLFQEAPEPAAVVAALRQMAL
jgi:thiamine-phosphate pyrophosphorylase